MSAVIVPLDPDSPAGIAAAERLTQVLGEIWLAICERRAAAKAATDLGPSPARTAGIAERAVHYPSPGGMCAAA